jgi:predicted DNA-binding transcriptional regulator AlpA
MNRKYHWPETQDQRRKIGTDQTAAPALRPAALQDSAPYRGNDLERSPRVSDVQFDERLPAPSCRRRGRSPSSRTRVLSGRSSQTCCGDCVTRRRVLMGTPICRPTSNFCGSTPSPVPAPLQLEPTSNSCLHGSPYEPDDLRLKNFQPQQAAARPPSPSGQGAGHARLCSKLSTAWPGLMCPATAVDFLGQIAVSTFLREVAAARIPRPVATSPRRKAWLKEELDAWRLSRRVSADGLASPDEPRREPAPRARP